jgi:hypothetical protein
MVPSPDPSPPPEVSLAPDPKSGQSKRRYRLSARLLAILFVCLVMFGLLEVGCYYYGSRYPARYRRDLSPSRVQPSLARKFMESGTFDQDLGWDSNPIARNYIKDKSYLAQSYGASFTLGQEVDEAETWQHQFEQRTGKAILNLGVMGYGLDQAVLKFEKYGAKYPTPYAILDLYAFEYRRVLSYQAYYHFYGGSFLYAFKPIFIPGKGGFELKKPPCDNADRLVDILQNPPEELRSFLRDHDDGYQTNSEKPPFSFPYSLNFCRTLPEWWETRRVARGQHDYFFVNALSLELCKYLVDRFVADCRAQKTKPLCLITYGPDDLRIFRRGGHRWDRPLLDHLKERNIPIVDAAEFVLNKLQAGFDIDSLAAPEGHFNGSGNKLIAEALAEYFKGEYH